MAIDLTSAILDLMSSNRVLDRERKHPNYGVVAALDDGKLSIRLTFRTGTSYCCTGWYCHLSLYSDHRWIALREIAAIHQIDLPEQLLLDIEVVIEDGALFFDFDKPTFGSRPEYELATVVGSTYSDFAKEGVAWSRSRRKKRRA